MGESLRRPWWPRASRVGAIMLRVVASTLVKGTFTR